MTAAGRRVPPFRKFVAYLLPIAFVSATSKWTSLNFPCPPVHALAVSCCPWNGRARSALKLLVSHETDPYLTPHSSCGVYRSGTTLFLALQRRQGRLDEGPRPMEVTGLHTASLAAMLALRRNTHDMISDTGYTLADLPTSRVHFTERHCQSLILSSFGRLPGWLRQSTIAVLPAHASFLVKP
eukprot:6174269-Pleurochrysis_carterae.AAC.3